MRLTIRYILLASFVGCVVWSIVAPGFDSILASLGSLAAFLGLFVHSNSIGESSSRPISKDAQRLLREIDACSKSSTKGITIALIDSMTGFYAPYLWSNHLHGALKGDIGDVSGVISHVRDLEAAGELEHFSSEGDLEQWRRI